MELVHRNLNRSVDFIDALQMRFADEREVAAPEIQRVVQMVNDAFEVSESFMWKSRARRISEQDIRSYLSDGTLLIVRYTGIVVGCIRIVREQSLHISMLAVAKAWQNSGLGSAILVAICNMADAQSMGLTGEILFPQAPAQQAPRRRLLNWYQQFGFAVVGQSDFTKMYPEKAVDLAGPAFLVNIHRHSS